MNDLEIKHLKENYAEALIVIATRDKSIKLWKDKYSKLRERVQALARNLSKED